MRNEHKTKERTEMSYRGAWLKKASLALLLITPAIAGIIPITASGSGCAQGSNVACATSTQIVIQYVATSAAACTLAAVDNNGGPPVADLDGSKFLNANLDLSRTFANGFRWPTLVDGFQRTVTIGGHDEIKQGTDGKWYSTALQVNSSHTITVTCNGGLDSGTATVSTANLPLASNYPEQVVPPLAGTPPLGGMPQPTIDWSRAGKKTPYTDPITGVLLQRISGGDETFNANNATVPLSFQPTVWDSQGAWTNPNNFVVPNHVATTTTAGAPLFAAFQPNFNPNLNNLFTDFLLTPFGSGSTTGVVSEWCISIDSGQTCANFTPQDVTMATTNQSYGQIPGSTPSSNFSSWGGMRTAFGTYDLSNCTQTSGFGPGCSSNVTLTGVNASGSTVTFSGTDPATQGVYMGLPAGSKFRLASCQTGTPATWYTVSSVPDPFHIITVENGLNLTNCSYVDAHAGIRVILKNSGQLNVSTSGTAYQTITFTDLVNGEHYSCAKTKVTDIQTDCDGNTQSPALSGYLCRFKTGLTTVSTYLIQDNGRMCSQGQAKLLNYTVAEGDDWTGNNSFLAMNGNGEIFQATHIPNNYSEVPIDPTNSNDTKWTVVDQAYSISSMPSAYKAQIINACSGHPASDPRCILANALSSGTITMGYEWTTEDGSGNPVSQWGTPNPVPCPKAWFDASGTLLTSTPPFGGYPMSYENCHSGPSGASGYENITLQGFGQLGPAGFNTSSTFGGPFTTWITGTRKNGSYVSQNLIISTCTSASPTVCTSPNHNLSNVTALNSNAGNYAVIAGATGTNCTALNGTRYLHVIDNSTFSVYSDPQGQSPVNLTSCTSLGNTITATVARPIWSLSIKSVSNNGGNARLTIQDLAGEMARDFPSFASNGLANIAFDSDPVGIVFTQLGGGTFFNTSQYYMKVSCSGCASNQIDLYNDAALTSPVPYGSVSGDGDNLHYLFYAETCPDRSTVTLPGPLYDDLGWGNSGAPQVRCFTVQFAQEFESDYPGTGEHSAFPPCTGAGTPYPACAGAALEASNASKSMAHPINIGDGMMVMDSHLGDGHELNYPIVVDRSLGENQIRVTYLRNYGNDPNFNWLGINVSNNYGPQHAAGWVPYGTALVSTPLVGYTTDPPTYLVPPYNLAHGDFVRGATAGNVSSATAPENSGHSTPDAYTNVTAATFSGPGTFTHNSTTQFAGAAAYTYHHSQTYGMRRMVPGQAAPADLNWMGDWASQNADFGNGQNFGDGWQGSSGRTLTATGIANVYKLQSLSTINIKIAPLAVVNAPWNYFTDVSGPASNIATAPNDSSCFVYSTAGGENCGVPGASQGDVYIKATTFYNDSANGGQCRSNDASVGSPCAFGLAPMAGWAMQIRLVPSDTNNTGMRRLTEGFWPSILGQYSFYHWTITPDAKWGLAMLNPIQQRPRPKNNEGSNVFAIKLPPFPTSSDQIDRTNFVNFGVTLNGSPGDAIRIAFGYGENGDPSSTQCTTRAEACFTTTAAAATSPFAFASETQGYTPCDSVCTIYIPAIPGRVLYYSVHRKNGSNESAGPITATVVDGSTNAVSASAFPPGSVIHNIVTRGKGTIVR